MTTGKTGRPARLRQTNRGRAHRALTTVPTADQPDAIKKSRRRRPHGEVKLRGDWPGGNIWFGQNRREHGGEYFLGVIGGDAASVCIPKDQQVEVALLLERFVKHLLGRKP